MKKNFIIYIFIIFLLSSFNLFAQREVDTDKLVYNEKTQLIHYDNEKKPFTGIAKIYYDNGEIYAKIPYKNGKLEGKGKEYYQKSGNLMREVPYRNGSVEGVVKIYYDNGNLYAIQNIKNGNAEGETISYYKNGNINIKANFVNNKLNGNISVYNEDGTLSYIAPYKNGKPLTEKTINLMGVDINNIENKTFENTINEINNFEKW